jgi:ATP/ADP translocase
MAVVLIACGVIILTGGSALRPGWHYLSLFLLSASVLILLARWSVRPVYLVMPCLFLGVGYGLFLSMTKSYANCCEDSGRMISLYNISQTVACLGAYAVSYAASTLAALWRADTLFIELAIIVILIFMAFLMLVLPGLRKKDGRRSDAAEGR